MSNQSSETTRQQFDKTVDETKSMGIASNFIEGMDAASAFLEGMRGAKQDIAETIPGGAVRNTKQLPSYSNFPPEPLRRLAMTYLEGKINYGFHNWMKGMPYSVVVDHFMEHWCKWLEGDTSEDHLAKIAWAMFTLMWYEKHRPELDDVRCLDYIKRLDETHQQFKG